MTIHIFCSHYPLTLDLIAMYTPLNGISETICLDKRNLKPPATLYPRTIIIIIIRPHRSYS